MASKIQSDDVFSKVAFVLSARVLDPQFQGQTKDKLTNRDALKLVAAVSVDPIELWLNQTLKQQKLPSYYQTRQRVCSAKNREEKSSAA